MENKEVVWIKEVSKEDVLLAGGKGANLGEMIRANFPVPLGFIVTTKAYFNFIKRYHLEEVIKEELLALNYEDNKILESASSIIKEAIEDAEIPQELSQKIVSFYKAMGEPYVAVRSSASAEDLPEASFAGQQATFLNVKGEKKLLLAIKKCWASLFEPRAIYYRFVQKFDHLKVGLAVVVQEMIDSEVSGVMFTVDPLTNDKNLIDIEAVYGLGEAIVSGALTPDRYLVKKGSFLPVKKEIVKQSWLLKKEKGVTKRINVPYGEQRKQKLSEDLLILLARLGYKIERHYKFPQDIEWAVKDKKIYIVQSRPVTTLGKKKEGKELIKKGRVLLKGQAASIGKISGRVKIIHSPSELSKVKKGDILVTKMTNPSFVPAMRKAKAIITDEGGPTSHAAIVSRELGIPCVVGTSEATKILKENELVTVDGDQGLVYAGDLVLERKKEVYYKKLPKTKTKIYVNLGEVGAVKRIAKMDVDGVGLLRAEFMIAEFGLHPNYCLENKEENKFIKNLTLGIQEFAKGFYPRPVIYRATDFKTNEYRNLKGGEKYEKEESNPMIGYRGAMRYIQEKEVFALEIEAIKNVRKKYNNVWLMIPFVRTLEEMERILLMLKLFGLQKSKDFKVLVMCEVPSVVILADKFIKVGVDGFSIGSNDLTQLILGLDRDNEKIAYEFDERNEAVLWAIKRVIKLAHKEGGTVSICGQAPSRYPEYVEFLVREGIDSISVNPDAIVETKKLVSKIEKGINK